MNDDIICYNIGSFQGMLYFCYKKTFPIHSPLISLPFYKVCTIHYIIDINQYVDPRWGVRLNTNPLVVCIENVHFMKGIDDLLPKYGENCQFQAS